MSTKLHPTTTDYTCSFQVSVVTRKNLHERGHHCQQCIAIRYPSVWNLLLQQPKMYIYILLIININDIAAYFTECFSCAKPCKLIFFHI